MPSGAIVFPTLCVLLLLGAAWTTASAVESGSPLLYCSDYHPQTSLDVHQITGMWFGSELLQHHDGDTGSTVVNSCVVIHISETSHEMTTTTLPPEYSDASRHGGYYDQARANSRQHFGAAAPTGYSYLRLIWDENGLDREVSVRYNQSRPGFWLATSAHPSGTADRSSAADPSYQIFTGTLQVMKAVDNHLVITFCQTFRDTGELFSILLTRKPNTLSNEDTQFIRGMLRRRGLNTASVRKVCASGASAPMAAGMLVAVATTVAAVWGRVVMRRDAC